MKVQGKRMDGRQLGMCRQRERLKVEKKGGHKDMKRRMGGWDRKNERIKEENAMKEEEGGITAAGIIIGMGGHWTGGRLGVEQEEGTEEIEGK
jgi:hypothetical protein